VADLVLEDPEGRLVTLRDTTWERHIIVMHPELAALRDDVEAAIKHPSQICDSRDPERHPTGLEYYGTTSRPGLLIKVATEQVITRTGLQREVKTAHFVKRVSGGTQRWP